ncbi:putative reverse transcriptase domain-containing protein [Tanacetum coccineum]
MADHSHKWHDDEAYGKNSTGQEIIKKILKEDVLPRGLGTPKPISMVIEMADRSMQSSKGIVENVLVKIDKFIFLVDFVILDIVEDNKVPIILGRPMLATAHVPEEFEKPEGLDECLKNDDINENLGDFLEENDLLPKIVWGTLNILPDSDDEMGIRLEDLGKGLENIWDA